MIARTLSFMTSGCRMVPVALVLALGGVSAPTVAQETRSQELTLEQLKAYIEEQKATLETVMEDREANREKVEEVQQALEDARKRESDVQAELESLCDEREQADPGSRDACIADNGV